MLENIEKNGKIIKYEFGCIQSNHRPDSGVGWIRLFSRFLSVCWVWTSIFENKKDILMHFGLYFVTINQNSIFKVSFRKCKGDNTLLNCQIKTELEISPESVCSSFMPDSSSPRSISYIKRTKLVLLTIKLWRPLV